jgi:hypothetical protein
MSGWPRQGIEILSINASDLSVRIQGLIALVENGSSEEALLQIDGLASQLGRAAQPGDERADLWRMIAAHLRAAEVLVRETHLEFAKESLAKGLDVVQKCRRPTD